MGTTSLYTGHHLTRTNGCIPISYLPPETARRARPTSPTRSHANHPFPGLLFFHEILRGSAVGVEQDWGSEVLGIVAETGSHLLSPFCGGGLRGNYSTRYRRQGDRGCRLNLRGVYLGWLLVARF